MNTTPLNDLEMFDLLQAAYPEKFTDDNDDTWNAAQQFADEISGWDDIADLLGRVTMLSMPMKSELTEHTSHCLGHIIIKGNHIQMIAAVRRDIKT